MPDQSLVCGVRQREPVFGTLKERGEVRRLDEHVPEAAKVLSAFEQFPGLSLRFHHLSLLPKGGAHFP
jgi:hypothetical protein